MQDLLGDAVKIKEEQVKRERQRWFALPRVIRESLYACIPSSSSSSSSSSPSSSTPTSDIDKARKLRFTTPSLDGDVAELCPHAAEAVTFTTDLQECVVAVEDVLIARAKTLQSESKFEEARKLFGDAAVIFTFVVPRRADWNQKGFSDDTLLWCVCSTKERPLPAPAATAVVSKALLGFSICSFKLGEFGDCADTCRFVLSNVDADSLQAAYWFARATTEAPTGAALETDRAVEVLRDVSARHAAAHRSSSPVVPANAARSKQQLTEIAALLKRLEEEKRVNDARGKKMFSKLFDGDAAAPAARVSAAAVAAPSASSAAAVSVTKKSSGGNEFADSWKALETQPDNGKGRELAAQLISAAAENLKMVLTHVKVGLLSLPVLFGGNSANSGNLPRQLLERAEDLGFRPDLLARAASMNCTAEERAAHVHGGGVGLLLPESGDREHFLCSALEQRLPRVFVEEAAEVEPIEALAEVAAIDGAFSSEVTMKNAQKALRARREKLVRM